MNARRVVAVVCTVLVRLNSSLCRGENECVNLHMPMAMVHHGHSGGCEGAEIARQRRLV